MSRRFLAAAALVLVLGAGCADESPDADHGATRETDAAVTTTGASAPATTTTSRPALPPPLPVTWESCTRSGIECGTVTVPVDYADPDGSTIDLALARQPAGDPGSRLGSLLLNPGGPGVSGVDAIKAGAYPVSDEVADRFDLVSWDTRGTGASDPLSCGTHDDAYFHTDTSPDDAADEEALAEAAQAVADECAATDADLLPFMSTDETVDDLDRIRQALGEDRLTYAGFSYGTLIGALYADRYPDRVRALVLDGVVDPSSDQAAGARGQAVGLEETLNRIFDECARGNCPVDDPAATYDAVMADLEAGAGGDVGPEELLLAAVLSTYAERFWPRLTGALANAEHRDYSSIVELADEYKTLAPYSPYAAILCVDMPHPPDFESYAALSDELERAAPRLGAAVGFEMLPCAYWSVPTTRTPGPVDAEGAPPILVVGDTGDAATPFRQAQTVANTLASGVLLTLEGHRHLSAGDECIDGWITRYVIDLEVPPEGTVC